MALGEGVEDGLFCAMPPAWKFRLGLCEILRFGAFVFPSVFNVYLKLSCVSAAASCLRSADTVSADKLLSYKGGVRPLIGHLPDH